MYVIEFCSSDILLTTVMYSHSTMHDGKKHGQTNVGNLDYGYMYLRYLGGESMIPTAVSQGD